MYFKVKNKNKMKEKYNKIKKLNKTNRVKLRFNKIKFRNNNKISRIKKKN
jgi:hypothetical protein